jgi:hypothetical protein
MICEPQGPTWDPSYPLSLPLDRILPQIEPLPTRKTLTPLHPTPLPPLHPACAACHCGLPQIDARVECNQAGHVSTADLIHPHRRPSFDQNDMGVCGVPDQHADRPPWPPTAIQPILEGTLAPTTGTPL